MINYKKLIRAKQKYNLEIELLEQKIKPFISFDFFIMYQDSDGFVIVHKENYHNAPLRKCIEVINEKHHLSFEDYYRLCI